MVRRTAAAVGIMILFAACGEQGAAVVARSTEATAEPTTTTTMPPASKPVVIVTADDVAGWWDGAAWREAADGPLPVAGGETYRMVDLGRPVTTAVGGAPNEGCDANNTEPGIPMEGFEWPHWQYDGSVAVSGDHDVTPRPARRLDLPAPPDVVEAARQMLAAQGVADPAPDVVEQVSADLDGDGTDEQIVVANHGSTEYFDETGASASIVFLRRVNGGTVVDHFVTADAPREREGPPPYVRNFLHIGAVADLNGDGTMEFVVQFHYYEGRGTVIHEMSKVDVPRVLQSFCGL